MLTETIERFDVVDFEHCLPREESVDEQSLRPAAPPQLRLASHTSDRRKYGVAAMEDELRILGSTQTCQNNQINKTAFNLGQLVGAGELQRHEVEEAIFQMADHIGYVKRDGERATRNTIKSGVDDGIKQPRNIPERHRPEAIRGSTRLLSHPRTDVGNGYRLVDHAGDVLRHCGPLGKWYVWDGRRWKEDTSEQVMLRVKETVLSIWDEAKRCEDPAEQEELGKWAAKSQNINRVLAAIRMAQSELPVTPAELDAEPMLLNVLNGTIDLRTGQLRPHRQKDLCTKLAPVRYDPDATCPRWNQFLEEITDSNNVLITYLQRLIGYCMTGDISEQILPIFHGEGGNGKNVLLDTIMGLMGDYAGSAAPSVLMVQRHAEHPTEIADLYGKRLVVASESEEGGRLKLQTVKRLTGDKTLKARFMRQDYFEFQRTHKTILVTNNQPQVRENSNAAWRRIRLVPFNVIIPEAQQDKHLLDKLCQEWPGILNWCICGCLDWQRNGLQAPREVEQATDEYQRDQDLLAEFVADACILDHVLGDN